MAGYPCNLRAHRLPPAIALYENIHPEPFPAGGFSFVTALFVIAALGDSDVTDHLHVYGPHLIRRNLRFAGFEATQFLGLCHFGAISRQQHPIVGNHFCELCGIAGLLCVQPIAFNCRDGLRGGRRAALPLTLCETGGRDKSGEPGNEEQYSSNGHTFSSLTDCQNDSPLARSNCDL